MSYLSQIPTAEATEYLRLDDNSNDNLINLMIASACRFFEDKTNHLIYQRTKDFKQSQRVYDYPIADTTDLIEKNYYFLPEIDITLTVGYAVGELPDEIKSCILMMVESQFYANESENAVEYPPIVMSTIQAFRRFYI